MSEEKVSIETCKELVSGEIATRSRDKYGDEVMENIKKANYEAGKVAGRNAAKALDKNDLASIADLFGRSVATKLFNPEVIEEGKDRVVIHWRSCPVPPLRSTFKEWGSLAITFSFYARS